MDNHVRHHLHLKEKQQAIQSTKTVRPQFSFFQKLIKLIPFMNLIINEYFYMFFIVAADAKGRKYECHLCHKRFTRPSTLRTHMNSHTGERPYACSATGCGWRFTVLSNLRRHMRVCPSLKKEAQQQPPQH